MTDAERLKLLEEMIVQLLISHTWMVLGYKTTQDAMGKEGDYSPELQHALQAQEALEAL